MTYKEGSFNILSFDSIDRLWLTIKKIFEETIQYRPQSNHRRIIKINSQKSYGVEVPPYALVTSADEAAKQAKKIGFPLVMKVVSPQILHKTDVGGVKVGIR